MLTDYPSQGPLIPRIGYPIVSRLRPVPQSTPLRWYGLLSHCPDSNSQTMVVRGDENRAEPCAEGVALTYDILKLCGLWVGHRLQEGSQHTQEQLSIS